MKKLKVLIYKREDLDKELVSQMWLLYESTYNFISYEKFQKDLEEKNYVFIGFDKVTNKFAGFSTALLYEESFLNREVGVIFSGDTVIHPDYWGNKSLHFAILKLAFSWKFKNLKKKLFWNLVASGNRTYLAMVRNCFEYYPRFDRETPDWEHKFIRHIGKKQFGELFNENDGVIIMDSPQAVFKPSLAPMSKELKALPEIDFFLRKNPGHEQGDELSSIAVIDFKLVSYFLLKIIKKKMF